MTATLPDRELTELGLPGISRLMEPGVGLDPCSPQDKVRMAASTAAVDARLAAGEPVYGLTRGFGPFVEFDAASEAEQGASLIAHLGTAQGEPLDPEVCRLVVRLRLESMRRGFSSVSPDHWTQLAELWELGFIPAIPRDGTVSASGDLQPLAHAALAYTGHGQAWTGDGDGGWSLIDAATSLAGFGSTGVDWPVREALAFVNGTGVSLAQAITNTHSAHLLVRAGTVLAARVASILGANPEHFDEGVGIARNQRGQQLVAGWIREAMGPDATWNRRRPLQEPYSLRCTPQVLGAVLDQLEHAGVLLGREYQGCTDNPVTYQGRVLHAGNFHAMPVGFASEQVGLAVHMAAYLAERQLGMITSPETNGGLPPMLTPRAGRGAGLAGVQISCTSFISRIRQLVTPASLTTLPTNGWNQDHVPMALNGANGVSDALELAWLAIGSLAVGATQLAVMTSQRAAGDNIWSELQQLSPPLDHDRPMAAEVRAAARAMRTHAQDCVEADR